MSRATAVVSAPVRPLLVTVAQACDLLGVKSTTVYDLAANGVLEKRYIGKGTRNFRLTYASLERYVDELPRDPVAE